ncbi:MAG: hypothetical protein COB04_04125 [Gammaproteobacteria bacterium]|nr:MAG: hypothetical protein COB04_04125 [Gammaproteobacteria bacterium]
MKQYGHTIKAFFSGALITTLLTVPLFSHAEQRIVDINAIKQKQVLDIVDVYELAAHNDADFLAAQWKKQAGSQESAIAKAKFLPKINFTANTTLSDTNSDFELGSFLSLAEIEERQHYNTNGYTFSLTQPLLNAKNLLHWPEAKIKEKRSELQYTIAHAQLIGKVGEIFVGKIVADENFTVAKAQLNAINEHLEQAKLSFKLGSVTITDTHEAQAAYDVAYSHFLAAQTALKNADHHLMILTGQNNTKLLRIRSKLPLDLEAFQLPELEELREVATQANPQLNLTRISHALAQINLKLAQAKHLPTLDLVASLGASNANSSAFGSGTDVDFYNIGLQVNVPVYSGGAVHNTAKKKRYQLEVEKQKLTQAERNVELELFEAYHNVELVKTQLAALHQAVESTRSSLESTKLGFEVGERTGLDVLNVQNNYFSSLRDRTNAQYQYILVVLALNVTLGIISEENIYELGDLLVTYSEI